MSSSQFRSQLERKRRQRVEAEKKVGEYRTKESGKRGDAAKARRAAATSKSPSTAASRLREADRCEKAAEQFAKDAERWQARATGHAKGEAALQLRLTRAEKSESDEAERARKRAGQKAETEARAERAAIDARISDTENTVARVLRELPAPKPEKLRVLILGASSDGDLRVSREQKRIRAAVQSALHRDFIEIDARPAATAEDLLDGLSFFRPHIVHFSGHSNEDLIVFEDEKDAPHEGVIGSARAFARAIQASDDPPLLVVLNSCNSASQIDALVEEVVPFAIGMSDSIGDSDAIIYAARFYTSIANGQSIRSAHLAGQAALELAGLESAELPTLASARDVDSTTAILVTGRN